MEFFCKHDRGFTLIEAVMVITLIGIIGTGLFMYFAQVSSDSDRLMLTQGRTLAEEKLETIIASKKPGAAGFSAVASEAQAALPSPHDRFTREVEVHCVNESDLDANAGTMPDCADSDIRAKRVLVRVEWPGGSTELVTVITDH